MTPNWTHPITELENVLWVAQLVEHPDCSSQDLIPSYRYLLHFVPSLTLSLQFPSIFSCHSSNKGTK